MNKNFSEKVKWFFTGYSYTRAEQILYLIKRLLWLSFVFGCIESIVFLIMSVFNGNFTPSLLIPAIIYGLTSVLFFKFD